MKTRFIYVVIIFALVSIQSPSTPAKEKTCKRQTIKNDTGGPVNDLKLRLKKSKNQKSSKFSEKPKLWHTEDSVDTNKDDINDDGERKEATSLSSEGECAQWAQNSFGTIPPGGKADIDYRSTKETNLDAKNSRWTLDGNDVNSVTILGEPMEVTYVLSIGEGSARFINSGDVAITYDNIRLFKNNSLSNFNILDFMDPTGTQVSAPNSVRLYPNESVVLSFGIVDVNNTYQLCLADVYEDADPNNLFEIASGAYWMLEIPGDVDGDSYVNFIDFEILADNWLQCNEPEDPNCIWEP